LDERLGDLAGAAQTCNQLAIVAKGAGRPAEAERWYRRAIDWASKLVTGRDWQYDAATSPTSCSRKTAWTKPKPTPPRAEIQETLDLSARSGRL